MTSPGDINVLLLEDNRGYATLVADNLRNRGYSVSWAESAADALAMASLGGFNVLLADVNLGPGPTGFDVASQLQRTQPKLRIVFLTNVKEPRLLLGAATFKQLSAAYIHKDRLVEPNYLDQAIKEFLVGGARQAVRHDKQPDSKLATLTNSQIEILRLMAGGLGNAEIAELRQTSQRAVEAIQIRILQSLGLNEISRGGARTLAIANYLAETGLDSRHTHV